ncbi:MAG: hypothetical protein ABSF70_02885 [Terracidiphilus sp.]
MGKGSAGSPAQGAIALREHGGRWRHPLLKELVLEASRSLAQLDAERLEELALSCQALNRDLALMDGKARLALVPQAKEAVGDMAVFARVLEVTRANLNVMNRLRDLREGRLEYREGSFQSDAPQVSQWQRTESGHGDN